MAEDMIELRAGDLPAFIRADKIDAVWSFDPYVETNGSCVAVNGVVVRVDETVAQVRAKMGQGEQPLWGPDNLKKGARWQP